jgi:hypothetical protein
MSQSPRGLPILISQSALRLSNTISRCVSSSQRSQKTSSLSGSSDAFAALLRLLRFLRKASARRFRIWVLDRPKTPLHEARVVEKATSLCSSHYFFGERNLCVLEDPLAHHRSLRDGGESTRPTECAKSVISVKRSSLAFLMTEHFWLAPIMLWRIEVTPSPIGRPWMSRKPIITIPIPI